MFNVWKTRRRAIKLFTYKLILLFIVIQKTTRKRPKMVVRDYSFRYPARRLELQSAWQFLSVRRWTLLKENRYREHRLPCVIGLIFSRKVSNKLGDNTRNFDWEPDLSFTHNLPFEKQEEKRQPFYVQYSRCKSSNAWKILDWEQSCLIDRF